MPQLIEDVLQKYEGRLVHRPLRRRVLETHLQFIARTNSEQLPALVKLASEIADIYYGILTETYKIGDISCVLEANGWTLIPHSETAKEAFDQVLDMPFELCAPFRSSANLFLKSLFAKHRDSKDRALQLQHPDFKEATIFIHKIGNEPVPDYAFGMSAILPQALDRLLWWIFTTGPIHEYFSAPDDQYSKIWAMLINDYPIENTFCRPIVGIESGSLGPSVSGKQFVVKAFNNSMLKRNAPSADLLDKGFIVSYFKL